MLSKVHLGNESSHRIIKKQFLVTNSSEIEYMPRRDYYIDNSITSVNPMIIIILLLHPTVKFNVYNTTGGELVSITDNVGVFPKNPNKLIFGEEYR